MGGFWRWKCPRMGRDTRPVGSEISQTRLRAPTERRGFGGPERTPPSPRTWERGPQGGRALQGQGRVRCRAAALSPPAGPPPSHPGPAAAHLPRGHLLSAPAALHLSSCASSPPAGENGPARSASSAPQRPLQPGGCSAGARERRSTSLAPLLHLPSPAARPRDGVCKGRFWFLPFLP